MRKQIQEGSYRSANGNAAFLYDQKRFPVATFTKRGVPRWNGSSAQTLLNADVADKIHERMTPQ
jgi:hypothetical protein